MRSNLVLRGPSTIALASAFLASALALGTPPGVGSVGGPVWGSVGAGSIATMRLQDDTPALVRRQIEVNRQTLLSPSTDLDESIRRDAATLLLAEPYPEATDALAEALRSGQVASMQAVLTIMQTTRPPIGALLGPALDAVPTAPDTVRPTLARVLAQYGSEAMLRVADLARDVNRPDAERANAIRVLGAFRSQAAARIMFELLEGATPPSPSLRTAVTDGLARLTGLRFGPDLARWKSWWALNHDKPVDQFVFDLVETLSLQMQQLDRQVAAEHARTELATKRLADALRRIYLQATPEQRAERLPTDLGDEFAAVRLLALDQIDGMLRDSEAITEPVRRALTQRLADAHEDVGLRLRAADLLRQIDPNNAPDLIAGALVGVTDASFAASLLDLLQARASALAVAPLLDFLERPELRDRAEKVLWPLVVSGGVPADASAAVSETITRLHDPATATPIGWRLYGALAPDAALPTLEAALDGEDATRCASVAEGLAVRGAVAPLIARVANPAVYPHALHAISRRPASMDLLTQLVTRLEPPADREALLAEWRRAVVRIAGDLPAAELVAACDVVAGARSGSVDLRIEMLQRGAELPVDRIDPAAREQIMVRLVDLLLANDRPDAVIALTATVENGLAVALKSRRFTAFVELGRFDEAVGVDPDPAAWVAVLDRICTNDVAAARPIREFMAAHFDESTLAGDLVAVLASVDGRLNPPSEETPGEPAPDHESGSG